MSNLLSNEQGTMFQAEASGHLFNAAPDSSLRLQSDTEFGQMYRLLDNVQEESLSLLQDFSAQEDFASKMASVFGEGNNYGDWQTAFASGSFVDFPAIKIASGALPKSSNAAYAGSLNTIYFSENFLKQYSDDAQTLVSVFVEELGHYVDWKVNEVDTPGDEGELFSALVRKANIAPQQLERLKQENDSMLIYNHHTILGNTLGKISVENSHSGYAWNVDGLLQTIILVMLGTLIVFCRRSLKK